MEEILRLKIEETNDKINQLMSSAIRAQNTRQVQMQEEAPNSSVERKAHQQVTNSDLVNQLIDNLNGLANMDLAGFAGNTNFSHLMKATNHLKCAQNEFQMAKNEIESRKTKQQTTNNYM